MRESGLSSAAVFGRRGRSQSRQNTAVRIRGGGLVAQRGVNAMVVVIESPAIHHPTDFVQAQEDLPVQELVAQLTVE